MRNQPAAVLRQRPTFRIFDVWRTRQGRLLDLIALWAFLNGFSAIEGSDIGVAASLLAGAAVFVGVMMWIVHDRKSHRTVASQYGGVGLVVLWPLLLPVYVIHSRGWRVGLKAITVVIGTYFTAAIVGLIVYCVTLL